MNAVVITACVALIPVAWLCWQKSLLHRDLGGAYQLVADMLRDPARAEQLATEYREAKIAAGLRRVGISVYASRTVGRSR